MVGVISTSLPTVLDRIERCAAMGIEEIQLSFPPWSALNDDELGTFLRADLRRLPSAEVPALQLPRAQRVLSPEDYLRLAGRHPNLMVTKNAGAGAETAVRLNGME